MTPHEFAYFWVGLMLGFSLMGMLVGLVMIWSDKPKRNCDVGTPGEQAERYCNFTGRYNPCSYRGYARCAEDCPVNIKLKQEGLGDLLCQLEWAQMPYKPYKKENKQ